MRACALRLSLTVSSVLMWCSSIGIVSSCGHSNEADSELFSERPTEAIDFPTWCREFSLQNCDVKPDDRISTEQWQAGVDVFGELMESLTNISLTRTDFERRTVQEVFSTFGANSLLSFISKIPWQRLEKIDNELVLFNSTSNAEAVFNGLRLIGSQKVVARFIGKQRVAISGLSISDSNGGNLHVVKHVDLSKPSRLTIITQSEQFEDIPVQFFQVPGFKQPPTLTPSAAFSAIANVVLEPGFDWRKNLSIFLKGNNLNNIYNRVREFIPKGPADNTTRQVISSTDIFMVGGVSSNILISMQMRNALKCIIRVRNIPILGSIDFDLDFLRGFGLSDLERIKSDGVRTKVYGISTSVGRIEHIEVDAKQMRMRIGAFTIPLDFIPSKPSGNGPAVDDVICQ